MVPTEPTSKRHPELGAVPASSRTDAYLSPMDEEPAIVEENFNLLDMADVDALQHDLDQALIKADENWKMYLGARAEMENLRRRTERDVQNAHKFALEQFANELLPVRDSMDLGLIATEGVTDVAQLREGLELTLKQLATAMEKFGIHEVNPQGAKFDHNLHEAIAMAPTDQAAPNTVIQVMQKGYLLNERLIRPAKVIVAQAVPKPSPT